MIERESLLTNQPLIIAGPCAIESREQILDIGRQVNESVVHVLRTQLWKPRTKPTSFQGVGEKGLPWIEEVKEETGLPVACEVMAEEHVDATRNIVDVLWVGSRNMQNYSLLNKIAEDNRPVILKRGMIATVEECMGAAEYIGKDRIIMCERGIRTGADAMRFTLDLNGALTLKHDYKMPVIIDPSHPAGRSDMVEPLALAGIAAGLDGIVVEVHNNPAEALSDANQQITPEQFHQLTEKIKRVYSAIAK